MQPEAFTRNIPGKLVKTPQEYWAFIPAPLPPDIPVSWEIASGVSAADRALSELAGVARILPNPQLLIAPFIRREAVLSSRIEGTQASLSDLFFFEAAGALRKPYSDVLEVSNYARALEYGLERLESLPVSLRLLREMHEQLMAGVRDRVAFPGEFRRTQNWIGPPGCTLTDATYVPPPVEEMHGALNALEKYLHEPSPLPPLVRLGLVHYQFEAIHPFIDGNGRIGRLLIILLMCADGLLPKPLLYLSAFFERRRDEYYRLLLAVSREGRWEEWIMFFLEGVASQSKDALSRALQLLDLWKEFRTRAQSAGSSGLLLRLVEELFISPAITVSHASDILDVTPRAAMQNIDKLVAAGIIIEATGKQRHRIFLAPEIMGIIDAPSQ